jgi:hypothetical protein
VTMTDENEDATDQGSVMPDDGQASEFDASLSDMVSAWAGGARSVTFERKGGGKGPGWNGDTYMGVPVQLGVKSYSGKSLADIIEQVKSELGGGTYEWRAKDSKNKWHHDTLVFPGAPKQFPGVHDPAADILRAQAGVAGAANGYMGPAPGYGYPPPQPGQQQPYPFTRLSAGWKYDFGQAQYVWIDENGAIGEPPYGVRPPPMPNQNPGYFPGGGGGGYFGPAVSPEVQAMKDELKELKTLFLAKGNGDGGMTAMATMLLQGMQATATMQNNSAQADREAAQARHKADAAAQAARDAREADLRKLEMEALRERLKAPQATADAQNPVKVLREALAFQNEVEKFTGRNKEDPPTASERMGEKIIDGLQKFADLGSKWLDADRKKDKPEKPAQNGAAQAPKPQAPANDGLDDDSRQWLKILGAADEAYAAGRSPAVAHDMLYATCKGMDINYDEVVKQLKQVNAEQLLLLMQASKNEAFKKAVAPIMAHLGSGDGLAWFNRLLECCAAAADKLA